jgi:hypothetical protein
MCSSPVSHHKRKASPRQRHDFYLIITHSRMAGALRCKKPTHSSATPCMFRKGRYQALVIQIRCITQYRKSSLEVDEKAVHLARFPACPPTLCYMTWVFLDPLRRSMRLVAKMPAHSRPESPRSLPIPKIQNIGQRCYWDAQNKEPPEPHFAL